MIVCGFKDWLHLTNWPFFKASKITQFDDPVAPSIFDKLVEVTGAKSVDWTRKLECCGAPVLGVNDELSMNQLDISGVISFFESGEENAK